MFNRSKRINKGLNTLTEAARKHNNHWATPFIKAMRVNLPSVPPEIRKLYGLGNKYNADGSLK